MRISDWSSDVCSSDLTSPVEFERTAYIRIGSATPRLSDHSDRLRALWGKLQPYVWESGIADRFMTDEDILARLDYDSYFEFMGQPIPDSRRDRKSPSLNSNH